MSETARKSDYLLPLLALTAVLGAGIVFVTSGYFGVVKSLLGFSPGPQELSRPRVIEVDPGNPPLPINLNEPAVAGASVYYRLLGVIDEVSAQPNGDLRLRISQGGKPSFQEFVLAQGRTVVTEKGKGFAAVIFEDIKAGDKVEIIYSFDLKSFQGFVTQAQIEK